MRQVVEFRDTYCPAAETFTVLATHRVRLSIDVLDSM
jgi:hypothetical protein